MRKLLKKICSGILVMGFVIMGLQGVLHAESVDSVQARAKAEFEAGNLTMVQYNSLKSALGRAAMSQQLGASDGYATYTSQYNERLNVGDIDAATASSLQATFDPM